MTRFYERTLTSAGKHGAAIQRFDVTVDWDSAATYRRVVIMYPRRVATGSHSAG